MSMHTMRFAASLIPTFTHKAIQLSGLALLLMSTAFAASPIVPASKVSDANARYQTERAACHNGQSNQDRATCLKEAGAVLKEAKTGHLDSDQAAYKQNALIRCNVHAGDDRVACQRRIDGEGTISGSVSDGGLLRELVVPDNK